MGLMVVLRFSCPCGCTGQASSHCCWDTNWCSDSSLPSVPKQTVCAAGLQGLAAQQHEAPFVLIEDRQL